MKKRILSIILAAVMCLTALSITSYAATEITEIAVSGVTAPVAGEAPDWDYEIPANANYSIDVDENGNSMIWSETSYKVYDFLDADSGYWRYENSEEKLYFFDADMYYTFIAIITPKEGYSFAENITATVNGQAAIVDAYKDIVYVYFPCAGPEKELINSVAIINVNNPMETSSILWEADIPDNSNYHFSTDSSYHGDLFWMETSFLVTTSEQAYSSDWYASDSTELIDFDNGRFYTFIAILKADTGYEFDRNNLTVTVNGDSAITEWYDGKLYIYMPFDNPNVTPLNKIEITDVDEPVAFDELDWDYDIPDNANYSKYYDMDGDCSAWIETEEKVSSIDDINNFDSEWLYKSINDGSVFFNDSYYTFVAMIEPDSGYTLSDGLTVTINGKEALVEVIDGVCLIYMPYDTPQYASFLDRLLAPLFEFFLRIAEFITMIFTPGIL